MSEVLSRPLDVVRLLSLSSVLPSLLPSAVDAPGHPGGIVALRHAGSTSVVGLGLADLEHGVPIGPRTVFDCASIAKQFTAAAVLALRARGVLELDDPLLRFLPELGAAYDGVTVRHLLFHTSGIRDYQPLLALAGARRSDYYGAGDVLGLLGRQRSLAFPCGTRHMYSNSNYVLLAQLVSRAAPGGFGAFLSSAVLGPAGLTATVLRDDQAAVVPGRARSYRWVVDRGYRLEHTPSDVVGDSGLLSSVSDLLTWAAYLLAELRRPSSPLSVMAEPGTLDDGTPLHYGYGLYVRPWAGNRGFGHGGNYDGFRSELVVLPDRDLVAVVLANWTGADAAGVVEALLAAACAELDAGRLERTDPVASGWPAVLVDEAGLSWELRPAGDGRMLLLSPEVQTFLDRDTPDRLTGAFQHEPVTVLRDGDGITAAVGTLSASLRPSDDNPPTAQRLAGLAGTYHCDELMTRAVVSVSETSIRWRRRSAAEPLEWITGDVFRAGGTWVAFRRGATGPEAPATELEIHTPRASGLVFHRED